jgi:excisionase family DNA binding protein
MAMEDHYTGHQVAEKLNLDYETVLHLAQTGELPSFRIGRLRRFRESDVNTFLDRQRDTSGIVVALRPRVAHPTKEATHVDP